MKPPGWSTFSSYAAQPGTTRAIRCRIGRVVAAEHRPRDAVLAAERGQRQRADDVDLGAQVRREAGSSGPLRGVHRRHRVLDGDPLRATAGEVLLAAAERREDQRVPAVDDVRAVELGRDVHGEVGVAHRLLGDVGVGHGGDEVAAHREEDLGPAVAAAP